MIRIPCLVAATSLFLFSSVGCTSLTVPHVDTPEVAGHTSRPVRCLCLWQPVKGEDAAGQPVRGFGGQVYFFAADSEEPVSVTGDVRVFIFDDIGTPDQQARPKDVQDFDPLVWKSFKTESQFGTNYTVFLPYAQASKYESVCSLRIRLTQPDGTQLFSEMATVKLSGQPREDKSIRQLVSPREHSISPERSRELRVDLQHRNTSNRAETIGSIQEGSISPANVSSVDDQNLDDHARVRIQRYESRLAEMHTEYARNDSSQKPMSPRSLQEEISDLMPAVRRVSRDNSGKSHRRITPAAHEIFTTEEPDQVEHAGFNVDRSQSSLWGGNRSNDSTSASSTTVEIRTLSRPLNRQPERVRQSDWTNDGELQALRLARLSE